MSLPLSDRLLWACGLVGHLALLFVLIGKSRWNRFPVFSCLIAYQAIKTITLYLISLNGTDKQYFWSYWLLTFIDCCLQAALIMEIASIVFRPFRVWKEYARRPFFIWSGSTTILVAFVCLGMSPQGVDGLSLWEMRFGLCTSTLTCGLFLCMSGVANHLKLLWRSHVMALGQGLTAWAVCAVAGDIVYMMSKSYRVLAATDRVRMCIYLGALVFWILSFWRPENEGVHTPSEVDERLLALRQRLGYR